VPECILYWLFDDSCICLWRHGYIGVTTRWPHRLIKHRASKQWPEDFKSLVLWRGDRDECLALERQLRPHPNIGWNTTVGGTISSITNKGRIGQKKSEEERAKISLSNSGKVRANPRVNARYGNTSHLGHRHSEETKEMIRIKKTGVPIHSDDFKKRRAERWKGNSLTKGKPWSAARRLAWLQNEET
jgi:hypothetical protein